MKPWLLGITLTFSSLSATVFHEIDSTKTLNCTFSNRHHNRIQFQGGRIRKVICPENSLSLLMEEDSGQVFVHCVEEPRSSVTLSVITDTASVQDLEITFDSRSSEVVVLQEKVLHEEQVMIQAPEASDDPKALIQSILSGNIPRGYQNLSESQPKWRIKSGVECHVMQTLEGKGHILRLLKLSNSSRRRRHVSEKDLACTGCKWVYLNQRAIEPRGDAFAILEVAKS